MGHFKEHYGYGHYRDDHAEYVDKFVCNDHINEPVITTFIDEYSDEGTCNYCGNKTRVALTKDVFLFIKGGVLSFYGEVNDEGMAYETDEGGFYGAPMFDTRELLYDEIGLDIDSDRLWEDLEAYFGNNTWCERDPYADRENIELMYNWEEFKKVVKHRARYVFLGSKQFQTGPFQTPVDEILNDIGRRVDSLDLYIKIQPGTKFYRCRQHADSEVFNEAKQLTAPPDDKAIYPNRMSPAGVSMFYCAFDIPTCHAETVNKKNIAKNKVTTGVFTNKGELFLLDLTNLPPVPSMFDIENRKHYYSILFLKKFVEDLSKQVDKDGREHIDYVPTQIVTEYFRYTYEDLTNISINGILYPSSKLSGHNACVLFYDHQQSLKELNFDTGLLTTIDI